MRKRILSPLTEAPALAESGWLNLEEIARVEVTSEAAAFPIEAALIQTASGGWRAESAGEQVIRLCFDEPQKLRKLRVVFIEEKEERTQEFVICWSTGASRGEIVRQQYNFSPGGSTREIEEYEMNLDGVVELELMINPDARGRAAHATLAELRVG